jgi:hypothetical protein
MLIEHREHANLTLACESVRSLIPAFPLVLTWQFERAPDGVGWSQAMQERWQSPAPTRPARWYISVRRRFWAEALTLKASRACRTSR